MFFLIFKLAVFFVSVSASKYCTCVFLYQESAVKTRIANSDIKNGKFSKTPYYTQYTACIKKAKSLLQPCYKKGNLFRLPYYYELLKKFKRVRVPDGSNVFGAQSRCRKGGVPAATVAHKCVGPLLRHSS
jgi:hypothetical protein